MKWGVPGKVSPLLDVLQSLVNGAATTFWNMNKHQLVLAFGGHVLRVFSKVLWINPLRYVQHGLYQYHKDRCLKMLSYLGLNSIKHLSVLMGFL